MKENSLRNFILHNSSFILHPSSLLLINAPPQVALLAFLSFPFSPFASNQFDKKTANCYTKYDNY